MSVATVYMTEFSNEAALKEVSEYYQKYGKTAYPEAEALIFVQVSSTSGMGIAMWPSEEIREQEGLALRAAFTDRFGTSIKEHVPKWGEVIIKQMK